MLAWQFFGMVISIVYREFGLASAMRYVTNMLGKAIGIYRCVRILSASVYIGWHSDIAGLEFGKMGYSRSEKDGGQGAVTVDCGCGVTVSWVKPSYRSIDEIYDEVIAECHSQSCSMRRAESRFSDHERYTDEEISRQRREVEEYGGVARISVGDDNDDSISLHDGEKIAIIGEARHYNPKAFGTQWRVRFEDGTMSVVFSDELSRVA